MPSHVINTAIKIKASPELIRSTLLDFESFPQWTSFISSIDITAESDAAEDVKPGVGSRLKVVLQPPASSSPMIFEPIVIRNDVSGFEWRGTLGAEFLFTGVHQFEFGPADEEGYVNFRQSEEFTGGLVFILKYFLGDTVNGFEAFNAKFKERVESLK